MPSNILFDQFSDMDETALCFWEELMVHLIEHDLQPVLIHYPMKARESAIPMVTSNYCTADIYEYNPNFESETEVSEEEIDLVVNRTKDWGGKIKSTAHAVQVAQGCKDLARAAMDLYLPVLVVIWNGYHLQQMFLEREAKSRGVPVLFMEKSPFPGYLFFDESGILARSSFANLPLEGLDGVDENTEPLAEEFLCSVIDGPSWYEQPEAAVSIHQKLGIPSSLRLLGFYGQIDSDTQNFLFSPHFETNCQAWDWFVKVTNELGLDYYRVGKHHPKSLALPSAYSGSPAHRAEWRQDIPIDVFLGESHALASVNSTANTETMVAGKPALYLGGGSYFNGKDVAYYIDPSMPEKEISAELEAWVNHTRATEQRFNLQRCVVHMLRHHLVALNPSDRSSFGLSLESIANWLSEHSRPASVAKISEEKLLAARSFIESHQIRASYLHGIQACNTPIHGSDQVVLKLRERVQLLGAEKSSLKTQVKKLKTQVKELKRDIHSAETWQRSWVKRVFHRWRPKHR